MTVELGWPFVNKTWKTNRTYTQYSVLGTALSFLTSWTPVS